MSLSDTAVDAASNDTVVGDACDANALSATADTLATADASAVRQQQRMERRALRDAERATKSMEKQQAAERKAQQREARRAERLAAKEAAKNARADAEHHAAYSTQPPANNDARTEDALDASWWDALGSFMRASARLLRTSGRYSKHAAKRVIDVADGDVLAQLAEVPFFAVSQFVPHSNIPTPDTTRPPEATAAPAPLVVIHGLGGSAGNFAGLKLWVRLHKPRPIHAFDYRNFEAIDDVVSAFQDWLSDVQALYPGQRVDIVAHSLGGLITRAALHDRSLAAGVRRIMTLGTPHQGTHLARWGGSRWVRELRIDSPLILRLNAEDARAFERENLDIVAYWTDRDIMVLPGSNATLDGATNIAMHDATHLTWLLKPKMIRHIIETLDADTPSTALERAPAV